MRSSLVNAKGEALLTCSKVALDNVLVNVYGMPDGGKILRRTDAVCVLGPGGRSLKPYNFVQWHDDFVQYCKVRRDELRYNAVMVSLKDVIAAGQEAENLEPYQTALLEKLAEI